MWLDLFHPSNCIVFFSEPWCLNAKYIECLISHDYFSSFPQRSFSFLEWSNDESTLNIRMSIIIWTILPVIITEILFKLEDSSHTQTKHLYWKHKRDSGKIILSQGSDCWFLSWSYGKWCSVAECKHSWVRWPQLQPALSFMTVRTLQITYHWSSSFVFCKLGIITTLHEYWVYDKELSTVLDRCICIHIKYYCINYTSVQGVIFTLRLVWWNAKL